MPRTLRHLIATAACVAVLAPRPALGQGADHVVRPGDTLSALAREYDATVDELRALNGLTGDLLRVGQVLALPAPPGWRSEVAPAGAGWDDVARAWGLPVELVRAANPTVADPGGHALRRPPADGALAAPRAGEDLIAFAARVGAAPGALALRNGLAPPYALAPGAPLLLPEGAAPPDGAAPIAAPNGAPNGASNGARSGAQNGAPHGATDAAPHHEALRAAALARLPALLAAADLRPPDDGFAWPLAGPPRITSRFGWRNVSVAGNRYHGGLDLGAPHGTPVLAARDGTVVRAAWSGAYGYAVYLRHEGGTETRYAHLSRIAVEVGRRVTRGTPVGTVGSTGASTGPHLHFEVRSGGRALDPLLVLPGGASGTSTSR